MTELLHALAKAGLTEPVIAPEPQAKARVSTLPDEVLGQPITQTTWGTVPAIMDEPDVKRVYFSTGRRDDEGLSIVRRVMDAFVVNDGKVIEVRLHGEENYRSFTVETPANLILIGKQSQAEQDKARKARERNQREAERRARQIERSKAGPVGVKGSKDNGKRK